ncbi:TetR/AcrR family transcriptional regulator [Rhizobium sullae]|uniref:TetR/AcrR family transcriptional regulator n=1 Tax=Rhizobium sullae TaxID=50338 RepID=A0A2N0D1L7_RHISU|nr:TetR/AcrR family transcriptional regulator [Rhizobium sullae]PKA39986.1 TetR/AcrR family transcriptional regulator [Rhizobium sullae]
MRYQSDHKEEAKAKLLDAAGRGFRRQGFGGIGVDGLAKEAGVTSGAFYGHFKSKDAAFEAAAVAGLDNLRESIAKLQAEEGDRWTETFIDFYLGELLRCSPDNSCGLQSLTSDVTRSSKDTKTAYGMALESVAQQLADKLEGRTEEEKRRKAWSLMALLSGGVTMARSVASPELQDSIASHLKQAARLLLRH